MTSETWIYLIIAVISWGLGSIFDKITLKYLDATSSFYGRTFVMLIFFVILLSTRFSKTFFAIKNSPKSLIYLSLSVLVTMLGVFAYLKAMSYDEASRIVPLSSTYPLITFIVAVFFLGESFTILKFLGTILVIIGIYFISK
jgi:transporter family protein